MTNKDSLSDLLRILSGPRLAFLAFIVAGGYFLWTEHQAHLLAALPYLILLLCPLLHIFMKLPAHVAHLVDPGDVSDSGHRLSQAGQTRRKTGTPGIRQRL